MARVAGEKPPHSDRVLAPSGFRPFVVEVATSDGGRRYEVVELLSSQELVEEGQAMRHCVSSYAGYCESGRTSIWSLRKWIESGRFIRLATVEVRNNQRFDRAGARAIEHAASPGRLAILGRWQNAGGPRLSRLFTT